MADSGWTERFTADRVAYYYNTKTEAVSWDKPDALKSAEELKTESGTWRWIPDPDESYIPGREIQRNPDGSIDCVTEKGVQARIPKGGPDWTLMKSSLTMLVDDLVLLDNMNEGLIIHTLRERFKKNHIYTNIGTILVSINPFKMLPLYTPAMIDKYFHSGGNRKQPPHVFAIADAAYKSLLYNKLDNAILISGESGAGKTEATKQCLTFFAEVAGSESHVEQKIMSANPILEAFGNARTVRNNNSSRFGKWTEVHFDRKGRICGAKNVNFLLEKSRVIYQAKDERNYHIFYQLCTGSMSAKYKVTNNLDSYSYLNQSGCTSIKGVSDPAEFEDVLSAMDNLGIPQEEKDWIFTVISGILHMGNVDFRADKKENAEIVNPDLVAKVADLLKLNKDVLTQACLSRTFTIRGQQPTKIPFKPWEARDALDGLAKSLYGLLFDWLVNRINKAVTVEQETNTKFVGVLDIFGFEIFQVNSFEQLCINFANEKLQQHFNQYTFKLEEEVYRTEQVKFVHIEFIDNQPILDLIEKKPNGLLVLLDEEIVMPKGTDETYCAKIHKLHEKNEYYKRLIKKDTALFIKHYAGEVLYDADGFLNKNKDVLPQDLYDAMSSSQEKRTASFYPVFDKSQGERKKVSLGGQFREQLNNLMTKLSKTAPHYIRCVKPNPNKSPEELVSPMVLEQLRYAGVFEAIRIRQQGYPFRYPHQEFVKRYKCLSLKSGGWLPLKSKDSKSLCKELLDITKQNFSQVQIGVTQVLYRAEQQRILELLRNLSLEKVCLILQSVIRGWLARRFKICLRKSRPVLRDALKKRSDLPAVEKALEFTSATIGSLVVLFPFEMKDVTDVKFLRGQLIERKRVTEVLEKIFPQDPEANFDKLSDAVAQGDAIADYPGTPQQMEIYKKTKDKLILTIERRKTRAELKAGVDQADKVILNAAIARAKELGIENIPEVKFGLQMLDRIAKEEKVIEQLNTALNSGGITKYSDNAQSTIQISALDTAIKGAAAFGVKTKEGKKILDLGKVVRELRSALQQVEWSGFSHWSNVEAILGKVAEESADNLEVKWAADEITLRTRRREVLEPLKAAMNAIDEENLQLGVNALKEVPELGEDQARRLQQLQDEVAGPGQELLDRVVQVRESLEAAVYSHDEDQLDGSIYIANELPVTPTTAAHLQELLVMAEIDLAMKAKFEHGERDEVSFMLDDKLAAANEVAVTTGSGAQAALKKADIISKLESQLEKLKKALDHAGKVQIQTEPGQTMLEKGQAIRDLRVSLLGREWNKVEQILFRIGSLQFESAEIALARSEVAGRAAAEDVLAKLDAAVKSIPTPSESLGHPAEGILETGLSQARRLKMKEVEVLINARNYYQRIVDTRKALQKGLDLTNFDSAIILAEDYTALYGLMDDSIQQLTTAVYMAEEFYYETKEVKNARHLQQEFTLLTALQKELQVNGYLEGAAPYQTPALSVVVDGLQAAFNAIANFDLTTKVGKYIVNKAKHILAVRKGIVNLAKDERQLEKALKESTAIGSETPEVTSGKQILDKVVNAIHHLQTAEAQVIQSLLEEAVELAEQIFYENDNVARARALRDRVIELNEESRNALWVLDRDRMKKVLTSAQEIRLNTAHFEKIGILLALSEEDYLKLEIKKAAELDDLPRKIRLTIRLKEIYLDQHGDMFTFDKFKNIRTITDFANQKMISMDRKKLAAGMLHFTKHPIHTSLTDIQDPLIIKEATKLFKNVLGYMGDRKYPYPPTLAEEILQKGIEQPGLRDEIFCQIIKQISQHPLPMNQAKGWELLALCASTFAPSKSFENFLEMYFRKAPQYSSKYIAAMRDVLYSTSSRTAMTAAEIERFVPEFCNPLNPTGQSKFAIPQPIKTGPYSEEFFSNPDALFLKSEVIN